MRPIRMRSHEGEGRLVGALRQSCPFEATQTLLAPRSTSTVQTQDPVGAAGGAKNGKIWDEQRDIGLKQSQLHLAERVARTVECRAR